MWQIIHSNVAVYSVLLSMLAIGLTLMYWDRRKARRDIQRIRERLMR
jgi:uncharacterized membrane protein YsdA (DUF1294 family)